MSSREPATVSFSLEEFSRHGGLTAPHKDGWGVAFFEGRDARIVRESRPASGSGAVAFIREQAYRGTTVISHIRQATVGEVALANTQPFCRELGGRVHVFAHNGDLLGIAAGDTHRFGRFRPVGNSDSEAAFCTLLGGLESLWLGRVAPPLEARFEVVSAFAEEIRALGPANFAYSDSEYLFVHGHARTQPSDGVMRPPGLYMLSRRCRARHPPSNPIRGLDIGYTADEQEVLLAASVPLTGERWVPLGSGELLVVARGRVLKTSTLA